MNALAKMVLALQKNGDSLSNFKSDPTAFIEKFLGVDLPNEQINSIIAGIGANFLGESKKGAVDASGNDFADIISKISSLNLDANGDGKIGLDDIGGILGSLSQDKGDVSGLLGKALKSFKI